MFCALTQHPSRTMFHVHLMSRFILDEMFCICSVHLFWNIVQVFFTDVLSGWFVHCWKWCIYRTACMSVCLFRYINSCFIQLGASVRVYIYSKLLYFLLFENGSHSVAQDGLKLVILLLTLESHDYMHVASCLALLYYFY
jgi:hypothetical protein